MEGKIYYTRLEEGDDNAHWVILRHPDGKLSNPKEPNIKYDACEISLTGIGIHAASRGEAQIKAGEFAEKLNLDGYSYMDAYTLTHPVIVVDKNEDDDES